MFKNLKLSTKLALGFGLLIVIACSLGSLAVWNMKSVANDANSLAKENVPEVKVAMDIERNSLQTMYNMRGYAYTSDEDFYQKGKQFLEVVKTKIKDAKDLAEKSKDLVKLKENAAIADTKIGEYANLVEETFNKQSELDKKRDSLNDAAAKYMTACSDFLKGQDELFEKDLQDGADAAKIKERVFKMNSMNDVIDLGNATRIDSWKAQSLRNPDLLNEAIKNFPEINKKLDEIKAVTHQDINLKQIETIRASGETYKNDLNGLHDVWIALEELSKKRGTIGDEVLKAASSTSESSTEETNQIADEASSSLSSASMIMIIGLIVAVILGIVIAIFLTRSITKPINRVIDGMTTGSEQVSSASGQVSSASQQMAEGANEQASSLEEISSSLEEMTSMTKQNADNAKQANTLATESKKSANDGKESMVRMSSAIDKIKISSDETAKIIKTIDEIAFQTNLLALNAAVEAARAGEAGKGFAVVAEEVRNLAQRSAQAAKNTSELIEGSQKNSEEGVRVTGEVREILVKIAESAEKVANLIAEVSAASDEQAQGIDQVNTAVAQLDKVTQSNAANAEESASASEELSAQARELNDMVGDLVAIVGGSRANTDMKVHSKHIIKHAPVQSKDDHIHTHVISLHKSQGKAAKTMAKVGKPKVSEKVVNPEEIIPLDDHELNDF